MANRRLRCTVIVLALVVCLPAAAPGDDTKPAPNVADDFVSAEPHETLPTSLAAALAGIKAPALAATIAFLASPGMEGRGMGSRGLDAAAG